MSFDVRPVDANSSALSIFGWREHVLFWMYNTNTTVYFKHDKDGALFSRVFNASSRGTEMGVICKETKTDPVSPFGEGLEQSGGSNALVYDDVFVSQPKAFSSVNDYMSMSLFIKEPSRERLATAGSFAWSF